ncbi:MAG: adenosylcobalamin-dependent ribonucleoside-diphosphate reductase [Candidatus Aminicenantes bacterium]|nr:adenosylcobalamin-dependent ribonucleoside-diphosphate reductase [Candidatus Aminicenantes bacterium]
MAIDTIRKRDGTEVPFDPAKIRRAVFRAAYEVLQDDAKSAAVADRAVPGVLDKTAGLRAERPVSVEDVQDIVERVLMEIGEAAIARAYIVYREEHKKARMTKVFLGVQDDLKLPLNTLLVLRSRYLLKDDRQTIVETPKELFARVARSIAAAEDAFKPGGRVSRAQAEDAFFRLMTGLEFLPNSPTLMNAGTALGQLSACFVLPVEDSMDGIFGALRNMAKIHQTGGGTGFDFSRLRPKGDLVATTKGLASGPVSFMRIFNQATGVIVQGGRRRGANMGILRCDHPDIAEFIEAKLDETAFTNFNLSIAVTDAFMEAVETDAPFALVNPHTGKTAKTVRARNLYDLIVFSAWKSGDPGLVFVDEINRGNPTPGLGRIEATNPCGEIPLLPYESCNLGSINLVLFARDGAVDWPRLAETIRWGVRFLDDVIEVNQYPIPEIRTMTTGNRKIGLGIMGFADLLIKLGIPYTSEEAEKTAEDVMRFVREESLKASAGLAEERGVFPYFEKSVFAQQGPRLRNATLNTVAPTGTISIIAGCSSGIEPLFALSFVRNVLSGTKLFEVHPLFEREMMKRGLANKDLMARVGKAGSIRDFEEIPEETRRVFVTALDVPPAQHIRIQAAFQRHTDNSVSKTINLPYEASADDIRDIYAMAHALGLKGITVYRYGTKKEQVLSFEARPELQGWAGAGGGGLDFVTAGPEFSGGCVKGTCLF